MLPSNMDIYMAMGNIIKAVAPEIKQILLGADMPRLQNEKIWTRFDFLGDFGNPARKRQVQNRLPFQLICYSRSATLDEDNDAIFTEYIRLSDLYKEAFNQKDYMIKTACIQFQESRISYLDLRTSTFTAKSISTGTTPSLATQAAVILADAYLISNKDS